MGSQFDFYEKLFSKLNIALSTYWQDAASNVIGSITPVAMTLLTIYVMMWGWGMMRGMISEPLTDGVSRIFRLSVIIGIALSVGRYNTYLADMLWNSPETLAAIVSSDSHSDGKSNMQFLDSLMSQFYDMGQAYNDKANADTGVTGIPDLSLWLTGFFVWLFGVALTGYGAFLLVLSKIALSILLGIGPLFILMTVFEPTKRFFDAWVGQALNYVFLVMLTAGVVKVIMVIIQSYLTAPDTVAALADPSVNQALPAIVFSIIGVLVMMQLPSIASALGGGVAIGTLGAVGWAVNKAKSGASAIRPTNAKRSINRVRSDLRIAGSSVKSIASIPKAAQRKISK